MSNFRFPLHLVAVLVLVAGPFRETSLAAQNCQDLFRKGPLSQSLSQEQVKDLASLYLDIQKALGTPVGRQLTLDYQRIFQEITQGDGEASQRLRHQIEIEVRNLRSKLGLKLNVELKEEPRIDLIMARHKRPPRSDVLVEPYIKTQVEISDPNLLHSLNVPMKETAGITWGYKDKYVWIRKVSPHLEDHLFDLSKGVEIEIPRFDRNVRSFALAQDAPYAAVTLGGGQTIVFDLETGRTIAKFFGELPNLPHTVFSTGVLLGFSDHGYKLHTFSGDEYAVGYHPTYDAISNRLAWVYGKLEVMDMATGKLLDHGAKHVDVRGDPNGTSRSGFVLDFYDGSGPQGTYAINLRSLEITKDVRKSIGLIVPLSAETFYIRKSMPGKLRRDLIVVYGEKFHPITTIEVDEGSASPIGTGILSYKLEGRPHIFRLESMKGAEVPSWQYTRESTDGRYTYNSVECMDLESGVLHDIPFSNRKSGSNVYPLPDTWQFVVTDHQQGKTLLVDLRYPTKSPVLLGKSPVQTEGFLKVNVSPLGNYLAISNEGKIEIMRVRPDPSP